MKKTIAALAACTLMPLTSQAAVLRYEFTATVKEITQFLQPVSYGISEGPTAGSSVALGDKLTGYIEFDTSTPVESPSSPFSSYATYFSPESSNRVIVTIGDGHSYTSYKRTVLSTSFTPYHSTDYRFWLEGSNVDAIRRNETDAGVGVFFLDEHNHRADGGLPSSLSLEAFDQAEVQMVWVRDSDDVTIWSSAKINSLAPVSAVPEPATYAMLSAGLLVGFAAAKRRRRG